VGCAIALLAAHTAMAYSVLAHEALIDAAWEQNIRPLLLERFPQSTRDDLIHAHAYAYGGCIIQDMGYYPFGNKFFTDLAHYVRSGDFVVNLLRESQDLDEYAFALGALAHYAADNRGHSIGVNPSVPMEYPKLERKFGPYMTYAEDPSAHLKTEFGFDAAQVARGHYAPQAYHDFIGFEVSKPVLERAFHDTYSLELTDLFTDLDLALGTYRFTVAHIIPEVTRAAWRMKKKELVATNPGLTHRQFLYNLSRASYRKEWGGHYQKPGAGAGILAVILRVLPPIGPLRVSRFKAPDAETERLFEKSFDGALASYRSLLAQAGGHSLVLPNRNLDTGRLTRPAEYSLADETYAKLAIKLSQKDALNVSPQVVSEVLTFYQDPNLPYATKKSRKQWKQTEAAIGKLKTQAAALPPQTPTPLQPHPL
jgi:hypothetical protein